jgi:hypothetical protein
MLEWLMALPALVGNFLWYNGVGQNITASMVLGLLAIAPVKKAWSTWHERHQKMLVHHLALHHAALLVEIRADQKERENGPDQDTLV